MHLDWHSTVEMAHFYLVSISLGAQVLVLSEFITFNHNISLTECVWA